MCFKCKDTVSVEDANAMLGGLASAFQMVGMPASINLGLALRMVARQSQSPDWIEAIDAGDRERVEELRSGFYTQALDYARDFPMVAVQSIDADTVNQRYSEVIGLLASAALPITNTVGAAMLTLSELIFRTPSTAPEADLIAMVLEENVAQFNFEKAFQGVQFGMN